MLLTILAIILLIVSGCSIGLGIQFFVRKDKKKARKKQSQPVEEPVKREPNKDTASLIDFAKKLEEFRRI